MIGGLLSAAKMAARQNKTVAAPMTKKPALTLETIMTLPSHFRLLPVPFAVI